MNAYEQSVLGAMMLDASSYWQVADLISSSDFADEGHERLFDTMADMAKAGKPIDAVTMGDAIPELGAYLIEIANNTPSAANIRAYAEEVRKSSEIRRVKRAGQQIATMHCTYTEAQRILANVAPRDMAAIRPVKAYMGEALSEMQKLCDDENAFVGLPTGLAHLDEVTAGLEPATLIMVAARPSMGKTALAIQLAVRNALRRKRVAVFEIEMSGKRLTQRAVSLISGIPYSSIRRPKTLVEEDWPKVVDAYAKLEKSALIIDESSSQTAESICARAKQLHMQEPLSLVVIDHLGLVRLPGKTLEAIETGHVTTQFKALAKDLDIPVIVLVQLNRKVEERHDKRPLLSDLRDSGRIEEDADIVVMIYRDEYYNQDSQDRGLAELLVRKNRDGEVKNITVKARLDIMRFETYEGETHVKPKRTVVGFSGYADGKAKAAGND